MRHYRITEDNAQCVDLDGNAVECIAQITGEQIDKEDDKHADDSQY